MKLLLGLDHQWSWNSADATAATLSPAYARCCCGVAAMVPAKPWPAFAACSSQSTVMGLEVHHSTHIVCACMHNAVQLSCRAAASSFVLASDSNCGQYLVLETYLVLVCANPCSHSLCGLLLGCCLRLIVFLVRALLSPVHRQADKLQTNWLNTCSSKACCRHKFTHHEAVEHLSAALAQSSRPSTSSCDSRCTVHPAGHVRPCMPPTLCSHTTFGLPCQHAPAERGGVLVSSTACETASIGFLAIRHKGCS